METCVVRSWRHHKARLSQAVDRKDHAAMRDAQKVVRDLESIMVDSERAAAGLPARPASGAPAAHHWDITPEGAALVCEPVTLADGAADQSLIPGVAPVPLTARQIDQERQRRETRHGHAPLPCGGLWDETSINQQELF